MSDFRVRYEAKLREFEPILKAAPPLTDLIPEFTEDRLRIFFKRTAQLLGQVDKGKVRRPAYLVHQNGHAGEHAVSSLDNIPSAAGNPQSFFQHVITHQIEIQRKLEFAVGLNSQELDGARHQAVNEIANQLQESENLLSQFRESKSRIDDYLEEIEKDTLAIRARFDEASLIISRGEKFRERLDRLDGDARRQDSMERLVRSVNKKAADAEEIIEKIPKIRAFADDGAAQIDTLLKASLTEKANIQKIREDAEKILGLASQAGLASSYISERQKLSKNRIIYNGIFYAGIGVLVVVGALYVLPVIESFALNSGSASLAERALILLIRSIVLAPIVWAIVFTSGRVRMIETLEIDYAEKAAASLAYHGYKSEMDEDASLLERLKSGLLMRFSEHPERLLRKVRPDTTLEANDKGFRIKSTSRSVDDKPQEDDGDDT